MNTLIDELRDRPGKLKYFIAVRSNSEPILKPMEYGLHFAVCCRLKTALHSQDGGEYEKGIYGCTEFNCGNTCG